MERFNQQPSGPESSPVKEQVGNNPVDKVYEQRVFLTGQLEAGNITKEIYEVEMEKLDQEQVKRFTN